MAKTKNIRVLEKTENKTSSPTFQSEALQKAVDISLPWFDLWGQFKASVVADIDAFEALLNEKAIPILAWVHVGEHGFLGWAPFGREQTMTLLFKSAPEDKPIAVSKADLETKVLIFPYISELSYLLCSRIKLAHTSQMGMDEYAAKTLGEPDALKDKQKEYTPPVKVAKYM